MLASITWRLRAICGTTLLRHPMLRHHTHPACVLFSIWGQLMPLEPAAEHMAAENKCVAVSRWLQISVGFLLPLLVEGAAQVAAFQEHQRERREAGLPHERGIHASVYHGLWALHASTSASIHSSTLIVLLCIVWQWCAMLGPAPPRASTTMAGKSGGWPRN